MQWLYFVAGWGFVLSGFFVGNYWPQWGEHIEDKEGSNVWIPPDSRRRTNLKLTVAIALLFIGVLFLGKT